MGKPFKTASCAQSGVLTFEQMVAIGGGEASLYEVFFADGTGVGCGHPEELRGLIADGVMHGTDPAGFRFVKVL